MPSFFDLNPRVVVWYLTTLFCFAVAIWAARKHYRQRAYFRALSWTSILLGGLLNALCIISNANRMPVKDTQGLGFNMSDGLHVQATSSSHLMLLADVHHLGQVARYSLGDVFIVASWLLLLSNWLFRLILETLHVRQNNRF